MRRSRVTTRGVDGRREGLLDPVTCFTIAALMMILNGAILGFVHRDLPEPLRPSAQDWRISTLLMAGGSIFLAVQKLGPLLALPLANGMIMLALSGYWRALRRFYGEPETRWLALPPLLGTVGVYVFSSLHPNLVARVLVATVVWVLGFVGCIRTLHRARLDERAISRRVLMAIFLSLSLLMLARAGYFLWASQLPSSVIDQTSWVNALTPLLVAVLPVIGTTAYLLLLSERISRQWERAASTDYLTGLANRLTLGAEGDRRVKQARDGGAALAIAVVDVDHFKKINDRFGHDVGDLALKHVATRLRGACRDQDLPARQGGEEFVVVFAGASPPDVTAVGERLRRAVEAEPFLADGVERTITVSIGVAALGPDDQCFNDLIRRADQALYAAKAGGRNRVELAA